MSDWQPIDDDDLPNDAVLIALDTCASMLREAGAGVMTMSGRDDLGRILSFASVVEIDGALVGVWMSGDDIVWMRRVAS